MFSTASKYVTIISVLYLILFFAFSSGLVNSIIEGSSAKAFVIPTRSIQTIGETIVTIMILFMGLFGVYLVYKSGGISQPKNQWSFLAGGFILIAISLVVGFHLVKIKSGLI